MTIQRLWLPLARIITGILAFAGGQALSQNALASPPKKAIAAENADQFESNSEELAENAFIRGGVPELTLLANQGNPHAQLRLGSIYLFGVHAPFDGAAAVNWFRRSADQGNADAQFSLGWMHARGRGVAKDATLASYWYGRAAEQYRAAAEQDNAEAQASLASMYAQGRGVAKDPTLASYWYGRAVEQYRAAAEQGNAEAQVLLAGMYRRGEGLPVDHAVATGWYRRAAEQGNVDGMRELALARKLGLGVRKDEEIALIWYKRAADKGDKSALYEVRKTSIASNIAPTTERAVEQNKSEPDFAPASNGQSFALGHATKCTSYGFVNGSEAFSNCLFQLDQIDRSAQIQQQQYELQRRQYDQQVAAYEAQQRAIKRERDRQRWETLARWGAGMAQSQSPSFGGALADANAAALGMPPVTKPPAPPPPPVFQNFTIRTASGSTVWCTYNAVVREVQCR